ncbi:MAG: hypothetical protein R3B96_09270 [Pirellulaceae bacterium]
MLEPPNSFPPKGDPTSVTTVETHQFENGLVLLGERMPWLGQPPFF